MLLLVRDVGITLAAGLPFMLDTPAIQLTASIPARFSISRIDSEIPAGPTHLPLMSGSEAPFVIEPCITRGGRFFPKTSEAPSSMVTLLPPGAPKDPDPALRLRVIWVSAMSISNSTLNT